MPPNSAAKHGRVSIRAGLDIGLTSARRASTKPYPLRNCSGLRPKSLTRLGREAPRSITGDTRLRPNRNGYISDFRQPSRRRPVRHDIPRRDQHSCAGVNRRSVTRTEAPRPCVPEPGKPAGAVECRLFAAPHDSRPPLGYYRTLTGCRIETTFRPRSSRHETRIGY